MSAISPSIPLRETLIRQSSHCVHSSGLPIFKASSHASYNFSADQSSSPTLRILSRRVVDCLLPESASSARESMDRDISARALGAFFDWRGIVDREFASKSSHVGIEVGSDTRRSSSSFSVACLASRGDESESSSLLLADSSPDELDESESWDCSALISRYSSMPFFDDFLFGRGRKPSTSSCLYGFSGEAISLRLGGASNKRRLLESVSSGSYEQCEYESRCTYGATHPTSSAANVDLNTPMAPMNHNVRVAQAKYAPSLFIQVRGRRLGINSTHWTPCYIWVHLLCANPHM